MKSQLHLKFAVLCGGYTNFSALWMLYRKICVLYCQHNIEFITSLMPLNDGREVSLPDGAIQIAMQGSKAV